MICNRCLYPDTKPDLYFNFEGVCTACTSHDKRKEIDWKARESELLRILETAPKNGSGYDCIVPSSGGKDSHWQVLKLISLGLRPLVVTAATCHLTGIGRKNIDNLGRYATTIEVTPNRAVRAKLNRLGLELVGDISWPEHVSIFTTPFRIATALGIPLVFYGECPQNQYGGPPGTEEAREMTLRWTQEFGGFLGLRSSDMIGQNGITKADMQDYEMPKIGFGDNSEDVPAKAYFLGQFYEWDSRRNWERACQAGMISILPTVRNWWPGENLDNYQTGLHDWMMQKKYGYGRATAQISVDIRAGKISRALALVEIERREHLYPDKYMGLSIDDILRPLGLDRATFDAIVERHTPISLPDIETAKAMSETLLRASELAAHPPIEPIFS